MKQFILYLFILLPFCVNSQVNETFDGPMLGADWIGKDRGQFVVNADGRLQLNIKPTESGTASIGKEIAYSPDYVSICIRKIKNVIIMYVSGIPATRN